MISYKNLKIVFLLLAGTIVSCTDLHEDLGNTFNNQQVASSLGSAGTELLLTAAYNDLSVPLAVADDVISLEGNPSDETLTPARGGDWYDNGTWNDLHAHTWNADNNHILLCFNNFNRLNFDATNVLAFNPSATQAAQARFLRALSLYYLLDLYGQYPFRQPGDNLLNAPEVKFGGDAVQFIINELNEIMPDLPLGGQSNMTLANQDACKTLLMKCYLNRGAFINRAAPTFSDSDVQKVISLGQSIRDSGKYTYMSEYFDNFSVNNNNSTENIFVHPNTTGVSTGNNITERWWSTLHYNQYIPDTPNAGWNGFTTIGDFYNNFGVTTPLDANNPKLSDTAVDKRIGGRFYKGVTDKSGQRPGLMIGQQYYESGVAVKDRKGHPLIFTAAISPNMIETGSNLELTGIRVEKYPPDLSNGKASYDGPGGNDLVIFRYADVVLMLAEAKMRAASPNVAEALALVNELREARGAEPMTSITLVNPNWVNDPKTLLAERGRELYWENVRRTDLIRFGVFLKPWQYKPMPDNPKNLLFPIPNQALSANPNLKQNTGY